MTTTRLGGLGSVWLGVALVACGGDKPTGDVPSPVETDTGVGADTATQSDPPIDTGQRDTGPTDTAVPETGQAPDTGDTAAPPDTGLAPLGSGLLVLGGGADPAAIGDESAWSARLFSHLLTRGDITADGQVRAVILTEAPEPDGGDGFLDTLGDYLVWLGADGFEVRVVTEPDDPDATDLGAFDVAFLMPLQASSAYDLWNDTALETELVALWQDRGGSLGANGDGSMLLAGISLAGGRDYISTHLLLDGHTDELDDVSDGGSALHDDFLPLVPGAIIDTHFTDQGRLLRLVGALARQVDEAPETAAWGMGIDKTTGVVVEADIARVVGDGGVTLVRPTADSVMEREVDLPPIWTNLALDRLTEGWQIDLTSAAPDETAVPASAQAITWDGATGEPLASDWSADGHLPEHEERFAQVVDRTADGYGTHAGADPAVLPDALGMLDLHFYGQIATNHEAVFRALYDHPGHSALLVTYQGRLEHQASDPGVVRFSYNPLVVSRDDPDTLLERREPGHGVIDSSGVRWRSLAPVASPHDPSAGSLHAAGLVGLRFHMLANSDGTGWVYDLTRREARRDLR